jgi:hypothetical protein
MRAFIPNPANGGAARSYLDPLPNGQPGSLVRLQDFHPTWLNVCFATDHRGFSSAATSTARLETRLSLRLKDGAVAVTPATARTTSGTTARVDCATGAITATKIGSVDRDALGVPAVADGAVQVAGQVTGTNRLVPGGVSPSIDYSFDFIWKPSTSALTAKVTYGTFPAFEVYARQPGGPWVPVARDLPTGTPVALLGDASGVPLAHQDVTVTIPGMNGKWRSAAPAQRFSIEISGTTAQWTERSAGGATLTRDVPLRELPDETFRIERPNDAEVLSFLGFQPALRGEILAQGPLPSYMILSWDGESVRGDWYGLLVTKDANAHLKSIAQPGSRPPALFPLARLP